MLSLCSAFFRALLLSQAYSVLLCLFWCQILTRIAVALLSGLGTSLRASMGSTIVLWIGWHLFMLYALELVRRGQRFYEGTSWTSPCSRSNVAIVFNNGDQLSVCGEQPVVLATAWIIWGFPCVLDWVPLL